jgi:hypothetical protein
MNGKGSKPRPLSVSYDAYSDNFDIIFGKKKLNISKGDFSSEESSKKTLQSDQSLDLNDANDHKSN